MYLLFCKFELRAKVFHIKFVYPLRSWDLKLLKLDKAIYKLLTTVPTGYSAAVQTSTTKTTFFHKQLYGHIFMTTLHLLSLYQEFGIIHIQVIISPVSVCKQSEGLSPVILSCYQSTWLCFYFGLRYIFPHLNTTSNAFTLHHVSSNSCRDLSLKVLSMRTMCITLILLIISSLIYAVIQRK
jgi:hypothetical protein